MCTPILVLHHHPGCHCPPNSTGTPPTHLLALCHPHQPPPSQIFMVSPVKTGTLLKIFRNFSKFFDFFDFLSTGPAPTTPTPPAHSAQALAPPAHPSVHLHAPFAHLSMPFMHLHAPCVPFAHYCAPFCAHLRTLMHLCAPLHTFLCCRWEKEIT